MGVYIRGMEMPHDCDECRLCAFITVGDYGIHRKCLPLNANAEITIRRASCPLIEIPDKHGRLIDADALESNGWYLMRVNIKDGKYEAANLMIAPTIIEADYPPSIPLKQVWTELFGEECE